MKIASNNRLLVGTAVLTLLTAGLYGCKDFLANNAVPQGTLDEGTLSNKVGVEGTLIAAYRALDCTNNSAAWGCAASNWVWGSVAADDSYKGSTNTDQPPNRGRAGAWTAKAYKGRVQTYAGQFAAAVTTLADVKTNGPYALETSFDHVWTGFKQFSDGPETIFAFQASANDGEPNGNNA